MEKFDSQFSLFNENEAKTDSRHHWLASFCDMLMILLIFFIILVSPQAVVSQSQQENMNKLTESLDSLKEISKKEGVSDLIEIEQLGNTGKITMKNSLLFESGSAELNPNSKANIETLIKSLKSLTESHSFRIQGHTDSIPINKGQYKSNWHLSTARALTILDEFIRQGFDQKKLSAQGFGEFRPLLDNQDKTGRDLPNNRAKNRRVEIYIK